jgi:hypothetical protein
MQTTFPSGTTGLSNTTAQSVAAPGLAKKA